MSVATELAAQHEADEASRKNGTVAVPLASDEGVDISEALNGPAEAEVYQQVNPEVYPSATTVAPKKQRKAPPVVLQPRKLNRVFFGHPSMDAHLPENGGKCLRLRVAKRQDGELKDLPTQYNVRSIAGYRDIVDFITRQVVTKYDAGDYEVMCMNSDQTTSAWMPVSILPEPKQPAVASGASAFERELAQRYMEDMQRRASQPQGTPLPTLPPMPPPTDPVEQMARLAQLQKQLGQDGGAASLWMAQSQAQAQVQAAEARTRDAEARLREAENRLRDELQREKDRHAAEIDRLRQEHNTAMINAENRYHGEIHSVRASAEKEIDRLNTKIDRMEEASRQPTPISEAAALLGAISPKVDPATQMLTMAQAIKALSGEKNQAFELAIAKLLERAVDGGDTVGKLVDAVPKALAGFAAMRPPAQQHAPQPQAPQQQPQQAEPQGDAYSPELRSAVKAMADAKSDDACVSCVVGVLDIVAKYPGDVGMGVKVMAEAAKNKDKATVHSIAGEYFKPLVNDGLLTFEQAGRILKAIQTAAPGERFVQELAKRAA